MRRGMRIIGTLLAIAGALTLLWSLLVWQWLDPFTALYTKWRQHELASQYDRRSSGFRSSTAAGASLADERQAIARDAARYRRAIRQGDAIGRIRIPRLGIDMVIVNGTDHDTLKRGPGRYAKSYMPGQNRLVYIAGHRTTYLAPFSHIDDLQKGDPVTIEMPYGTFQYRISGHRIVAADETSVLKTPLHERLILQACHPRFFASHRYLQYAQLVRVAPKGGAPYDASAAAAPAQGSRK